MRAAAPAISSSEQGLIARLFHYCSLSLTWLLGGVMSHTATQTDRREKSQLLCMYASNPCLDEYVVQEVASGIPTAATIPFWGF